ncbi:acyl carrier protein [Nitrospira sp. NS4]|uniref:acyl carrier protein n=1 Tax=Nitrospira sp. NS4 TaxID=3414498 RepID=UPI003C2C323C
MAHRTILDKITQALADYLKRDASTIQETHHLRDDLGLDSMAVIELLYKIEETFDLQIPDQDLPAMTTVGSVAAYVGKRLAPAKSAPAAESEPATVKKTPAANPKRAQAKRAPAAKPQKPPAKPKPKRKA